MRCRYSRREFLRTATGAVAAGTAEQWANGGETATGIADVEVLNPRGRVPLSFIIDDSTCLVNMGHFCTPQFAAAHPDRKVYRLPWRRWPREIPDAFVREFGEWCGEQGVKGKYSIVPYPACVGRLDLVLPGWSHRELRDSLKLIRDLMLPNWDIHPEMITHTRVIDLTTGHPFSEISSATMENSYPQEKKSVDELAEYLAYALRILKNCDLPCEGITTPGGFGNLVKTELSLAVQEAVRDVYAPEIPHYFKYLRFGEESTEPTLEHVGGLDSDDVRLTVNVPAGTGDWFGGWQGVREPEGDRYCNEDATNGRMVELIERGEPAVMLCHWPGMYCNGSKRGFGAFKKVVDNLDQRFSDETLWMKPSEMARYWAAKRLTRMEATQERLQLEAPFAAPDFTVRFGASEEAVPRMQVGDTTMEMERVPRSKDLRSGTWLRDKRGMVVCLDLPKGESQILLT